MNDISKVGYPRLTVRVEQEMEAMGHIGPRLSDSQAAVERGPARRLAFQGLLVLLCVFWHPPAFL